MGIQANGIGALDAAEQPLPLLRYDRKPAIGGVRVQPDSLRLAIVRHGSEGIDGTAAGSSRIRTNRDRIETRRPVLGHGAQQCFQIHPKTIIRGDRANVLPSDSHDDRRAR